MISSASSGRPPTGQPDAGAFAHEAAPLLYRVQARKGRSFSLSLGFHAASMPNKEILLGFGFDEAFRVLEVLGFKPVQWFRAAHLRAAQGI